jgi:WXG100 family type VII secretion target
MRLGLAAVHSEPIPAKFFKNTWTVLALLTRVLYTARREQFSALGTTPMMAKAGIGRREPHGWSNFRTRGCAKKGYQAVDEATNKIKGHVSNVDNLLQQLRGAWSGDASNAYNQLVMSWQEKARSLNATLAQLQSNLQATESAQIQSEQSHQEAVSGIAGMLS